MSNEEIKRRLEARGLSVESVVFNEDGKRWADINFAGHMTLSILKIEDDATLDEIVDQIVGYAKKRGYKVL